MTLSTALRFAPHIGALVLVIVAVVGVPVGVSAMERHAISTLPIRAERVEIVWPALGGAPAGSEPGPATWLPQSERRRLVRLATEALRGDPDPLGNATLERVARALLNSGWFARIDSVRRERGGLVRVNGTWRVFSAVARVGDDELLLSDRGVLLPLRYEAGKAGQRGQSGLPAILGAALDPPAAPGQAWPGGDVQMGLGVLDLLRDEPFWGQIVGVDVSGALRGGPLEIVTTGGGRIIWGPPPEQWMPGQVNAQAKVQTLERLFREYARIDAGQRRIDIRNRDVLIDQTVPGTS